MKLFSHRVDYNTLETLESFMELSKARRDMFSGNQMIHTSLSSFYAELVMTRFGFGRQSGQTTAIVEYMRKHRSRKIIYVTSVAQYFLREIETRVNTHTLTADKPKSHQFFNSNREFGMWFRETDDVEIIFDEVPMEQIRDFLYNYCRVLEPGAKIMGIVSVGSQ